MADPDKVFDIEVADRLSPGCGRHADPACLCDVDVSKTADIEWNRGPAELLGVKTPIELSQRWADYVYFTEIEGRITPLAPTRKTVEPDEIVKRASWPSLVDLPDASVASVVSDLRAGERTPRQIAAEHNVSYTSVEELRAVLRTTIPNGKKIKPWTLYACNRYAEGGLVKDIQAEIKTEWGTEVTEDQIRATVGHAGITRKNVA